MTRLLANIRIGVRLGAAFAIVLLLLCLVGATAVFQASRIYEGTMEIADGWLPQVRVLGDVRTWANNVRKASLRSLLETDAKQKATQRALRNEAMKILDGKLQAYQQLAMTAEDEQLNREIRKTWSNYLMLDDKLLTLSESGEASFAAARTLATGESADAFTAVARLIEQAVQSSTRAGLAARSVAAANYRTAVISTGVLILIALAAGIVTAVLITRSITGPIRQSVVVAQAVAAGDLTSKVDVRRGDEVGQLLAALNTMNRQLSNFVSSIGITTESVTVASREIANGNTDLSSRTEEQAASLAQTAASMAELTETVKKNADNAWEANTLAVRATRMADTGNEVVEGMIAVIEKISGSSSKVSEITGVIEGIAFQTNILALNAAVEAARAGEQGRGFAVVASEVRSLAQRSAAAAKEIKELISSSVEMIGEGAQRATEVGSTMDHVKQAIKHVSDIVGEIATASQEQSRGIEQVNQAVMQMDDVTQQNAALVEQSAAAAYSLDEQATKLKNVVSVFRISDAHGTAPRL
ncbi:methyl-accepting chemotaxis protein [Paraburkholderia phenoliruptrix]|uniref:Methyl-accepting chemotaxis protein n=1 Tax=Paraburkholderia phenoliruptrix TaxID=252970 RepID=A0ABV3WLZ5_9BURK